MAELTFHLEDFDGPLELLLTLVQAHKMDLHNIPILALIDQYAAVVTEARIQEPDVSSSFIEMAARLVEMKSRLLLAASGISPMPKLSRTIKNTRFAMWFLISFIFIILFSCSLVKKELHDG